MLTVKSRSLLHVITSNDILTVCRTPLDEWSARCRALYLQQLATFTTDKHPYFWRDSNPQSQQASGHRPRPQTARPLCRHNDYQGMKISSTTTTHWPFSWPWRPQHPSTRLSLCLAPDRQFLILSNMAASVGTIGKGNVEFSSTNVISTRTHTYTREDYVVYLRSMTLGKHTNVEQN